MLTTLLAVVANLATQAPLPTITIDSQGATLNADVKHQCSIEVDAYDGDYSGFVGLKWRGSSSIGYAKKSFTLETWDAQGNDITPVAQLLGMPIEEDWVLHGPYHDRTGLRDYFSYNLARQLGRWAPRGRYATLTLNGEYVGLYILFEKIKRDKFRVAVTKEDPAFVDRGYVFKMDKSDPDEPIVKGAQDEWVVVYPKAPTTAQSAFLAQAIDEFWMSLDAGGDPQVGFPSTIDVQSFVDEWIMQELAYNKDAFHTSSFFSKDMGGKIVAGPIWDFNLGYGDGLMQDAGIEGWLPLTKPWWARLQADPSFMAAVIKRWHELRQGPLATAAMLKIIDDVVPHIAGAATIDFTAGGAWVDHKDHMRSWIERRVVWMDANIEALMPACTPSCDGKACGWDGCGGTCGGCAGTCDAGQCQPACDEAGCELPHYYLYRDAPGPGLTPQALQADFADPSGEAYPGDLAIALDCNGYGRASLMRKSPLIGYDSVVLSVRSDDPSALEDASVSVQEASTPITVTTTWSDVVVPLPSEAKSVAISCRANSAAKLYVRELYVTSQLTACDCDDDPMTDEACRGNVCVVVQPEAQAEPEPWPEYDYSAPQVAEPGPELTEAGPETTEVGPELSEPNPETISEPVTEAAEVSEPNIADPTGDTSWPDATVAEPTRPQGAEALPVPESGCGAAGPGALLMAWPLLWFRRRRAA